MNTKNLSFFILSFLLIGCSSNKIVVEREQASKIAIPQGASVEIQDIQGKDSETFKLSLNQFLTSRTSLKIIHSQSRNELIDSMLRGQRNQQVYPQADFIIRGSIQDTLERRQGPNGALQFSAISRPFLQLIETRTGEVLLSQYFVGTSLSSTYLASANTSYDGYTDALMNARAMALERFVSQFQPSISWLEIELLPLRNNSKFKEVKNLINHGRHESARTALTTYGDSLEIKDTEEKGKVLFTLSVVESLLGNYTKAKSLLYEAHRLVPDEKIMEYLKRIDSMERDSKRVTINERLKYE